MGRKEASILALALAVRATLAWLTSATADESFDYFLSLHPPAEIVAFCRSESNPPGWRLLLHLWSWLSRDELVLRLPNVLLSTALVGAGYALIRRTHGRDCALWVAAWQSVSYPVWLAESSMRMYALLDLAIVLALLAFWEQRAWWLALSCLTLAAMHTFGILVVGCLAVAWVLRPPRRVPILLAILGGLALAGSWLAFTASNPDASTLLRTTAPSAGPWAPLGLPGFLTALGPLACLLWPVVLRGWWATRRLGWAWLILFGVWGVFWGIALLGDWRHMQPYQNRYMVPASTLFFACLASGLAGWRARPYVLGLVVLFNLGLSAAACFQPFLWNQDWRATAQALDRGFHTGDVLVTCVPYSLVPLNFYLAGGRSHLSFGPHNQLLLDPPPPYSTQLGITAGSLDDGLRQRLGAARVWLVLNQEGADGPAVRAWFNERYGLAGQFEQQTLTGWGNTSVYLLVPR